MKIAKMVILSGVVLSLAACACPRQDDYYKTPYGQERTAGQGTSVYDGKCQMRPAEPAPVTPAPVATPAEPVFERAVRK